MLIISIETRALRERESAVVLWEVVPFACSTYTHAHALDDHCNRCVSSGLCMRLLGTPHAGPPPDPAAVVSPVNLLMRPVLAV